MLKPTNPIARALRPLASLRLTVALFAVSLVLVFLGTVAQIDNGIWTVVDKYFWSWHVWVPFDLFAKVLDIFLLRPVSDEFGTAYSPIHFRGHFPFPAGKLLALALCVNLLAAHVLRFKLSWRRAGVYLIHSGLLVMLAGEVITREASVEQQMTIDEGGRANYAQDLRHAELVFIDPSDPVVDRVVAVPFSRLVAGTVVRDDALPVDIEVVEAMRNAELKPESTAGKPNPATAGFGADSGAVAVGKDEASGVETNSKFDLPAVYVRLLKKGGGEPLGTYLASMKLGLEEQSDAVTVDGKAYRMSLRPRRYDKPYTLKLLEFRFDRYAGTDKPRNYSSRVVLTDPEQGVEQEVLISMNNPLRHRGEAFFQSNFDNETEKTTVLQVVRNPGWMLPYVSCLVVAAGMAIHFVLTLLGFMKKRTAAATRVTAQNPAGVRTDGGPFRLVPLLVLGFVVLAFLGAAGRAAFGGRGEFDLASFAAIPVHDDGRIKPIDTVARVHLRATSGSEVFKDAAGRERPAVEWLLDAMTASDPDDPRLSAAWKHKTFYVESDSVLGLLGLEPRSGFKYSFEEMLPKYRQVEEKADVAWRRDREGKTWSLDERKAVETRRKGGLFLELKERAAPLMVPVDAAQEQWTSLGKLRSAAAFAVVPELLEAAGLSNLQQIRQLPPEQQRELAAKFDAGVAEKVAAAPHAAQWTRMLSAYKRKDAAAFNAAVAEYRADLAGTAGVPAARPSAELYLNRVQPFYYVIGFCVLAAVLQLLGYLTAGWYAPLRWSAVAVLLFAVAVHTLAIFARMIIQGRPPVTNLYSSAIFIGWGCMLLGLGLEFLYRNGMGNLTAAVLGFGTSIVAHNYLVGSGDTMEPLVAVLDTNFWLATHVTIVTLGYVATYVAALSAAAYLICGVFLPRFTANAGKELIRATYGVACFATLLSFVGTVLGGIWADQSWGRFWGWDPKENGAVMIVIWNSLILHARWGGLVKDRGIAVLATLGGVITTWSYFGTNQLQVGLHSYGFSSELAKLCLGVWIAVSSIACLGLLPKRYWASELKAKELPA